MNINKHNLRDCNRLVFASVAAIGISQRMSHCLLTSSVGTQQIIATVGFCRSRLRCRGEGGGKIVVCRGRWKSTGGFISGDDWTGLGRGGVDTLSPVPVCRWPLGGMTRYRRSAAPVVRRQQQ